MESIPNSLKTGIITPVYKGCGKDPLDTNSYRGVTLTSVLAKVLETLTLMQMRCHFSERKILHLNQTAYRTGVSCAEAIFSTMEVISTYSQCSEIVYMCFYDLQKAFDSIQYPVLLNCLYESGVNGKAWRLLRCWYTSPKEHGESEWPAVLTTHSGAWSSPRIRPFPSPLPTDAGPPPEILAEQGSRSVCG